MPKEPMSTFVAGGKEFEIVDKAAREDVHIDNGMPQKQVVFMSNVTSAEYLSGTSLASTYTVLQGGCYNSKKQRFVQCVTNSTYTNAILVELDSDFTVTNRSNALELGHGGDLTYNPVIDKIFVSTSTGPSNIYKICMVDANDLSLDATYDLGYPSEIKRLISYDPLNDFYYVQIGEDLVHIFTFDYTNDTWTELKSAPLRSKVYSSIVDGSGWTNQSTEVYNKKLVFLSDLKYGDNSTYSHFAGFSINSFDDNFNVVSALNLPNTYAAEEAENICIVGDFAYVFSGHAYLTVSRISLNHSNIFLTSPSIFESGMAIEENGDLDDYIIPGAYVCRNAAHCTTLSHCPLNETGGWSSPQGFRLIVTPGNWSWFNQEIIVNDAERYFRRRTANAFSNWERFVKESEEYYKVGETVVIGGGCLLYGIVTGGSKTIRLYFNLEKKLTLVNSVTVNALTANIRGINGYVNNDSSNPDWVNTQGITTNAFITAANKSAIVIEILSTNEYTNVTNNTPVIMQPNVFTLTLS